MLVMARLNLAGPSSAAATVIPWLMAVHRDPRNADRTASRKHLTNSLTLHRSIRSAKSLKLAPISLVSGQAVKLEKTLAQMRRKIGRAHV